MPVPLRLAAIVALACLLAPPLHAEPVEDTMSIVEIRSYTLKPGTRAGFHERFVREALPLLHRSQVDVVAYGPSLHDDDSYYLIRAFAGIDDRQRSEDAFYGS